MPEARSAGEEERMISLKRLECGHEVMSSATAHTVKCAVCKRLVKVASEETPDEMQVRLGEEWHARLSTPSEDT
jgi:hypothetical protein